MDELEELDFYDDSGRQLGTKSRRQVHADGDWHWLVFVWCAWLEPAGQARLLLQQRSRPGDPFVDSLDALAGGHVKAEESHRLAASRELEEESGLRTDPDALVYLGSRPLVNVGGACHRVVQHFYLRDRPADIMQLRFNEEVCGFVSAPLDEVAELLTPAAASATGLARFAEKPGDQTGIRITPAAFASYPPPVVDVFRRSFAAIRIYLYERRVEPDIWLAPD